MNRTDGRDKFQYGRRVALETLKELIKVGLNLLGAAVTKLPTESDKPSNDSDIKDSLRGVLLDSYRQAYDVSANIWSSLESKSQGNIAIAGIFVAGVFVFMKDLRTGMTFIEKTLLAATICLLLGSVILSMLSLRVRKSPAPPFGEVTDKMISQLLRLPPDDLKQRMPFFINDQVVVWRDVLKTTKLTMQKKARFLFQAQVCLWLAIGIVAVLALAQVFH